MIQYIVLTDSTQIHLNFKRHLHVLEKLDDRIFLCFFFSMVGGGGKKNIIFKASLHLC